MAKYDYITKEQLEELYITQNLSKPEIRKILDIPPTCLGRLLDKYGIKKSEQQLKEMQSRLVKQTYANNPHIREAQSRWSSKYWEDISIDDKKAHLANLIKASKNRNIEYIRKNTESLQKYWDNFKKTASEDEIVARNIKISIKTKLAMQKLPTEVKAERILKCRDKYFAKSDEEHQQILEKRARTKRKNKTWNTSKMEEEIYQKLLTKFLQVERQYRSEKYPFNCDFYIPELDLYIEYQGTWQHGGKPFKETHGDLVKISIWKNKNKTIYSRAIKIWTESDVLKRNTAKENNLNWIEFFTMNEFNAWLNQYT